MVDNVTTQVRLRPVVMSILQELVERGQTVESLRKRKTYAEWLAFGTGTILA
jgi:hypothetical protein